MIVHIEVCLFWFIEILLQINDNTEAGADGILLIASVLGPALENFLNLATVIGLGKLLRHVIALYVMLQ